MLLYVTVTELEIFHLHLKITESPFLCLIEPNLKGNGLPFLSTILPTKNTGDFSPTLYTYPLPHSVWNTKFDRFILTFSGISLALNTIEFPDLDTWVNPAFPKKSIVSF